MNNKAQLFAVIFLIAGIIIGVFGTIAIYNSDTSMTFIKEIKIKSTIRFMKANNIQIWGSDKCTWCTKQREEFGEYIDYMYSEGLYMGCEENKENLEFCGKVLSQPGMGTPFWTMDGQVIGVGFKEVDKIQGVIRG